MSDPYTFERLPLGPIGAGTTLLVAGPTHAGTTMLGVRLLVGPPDEGTIYISTNRRAARSADDCRRAGVDLDRGDVAIVDCVGQRDDSVPARVLPVSGPADLTGIGMRFSDVYRTFAEDGITRVRTGLYSLSTLLSFGELRPVSRFVHTLVGRIDGADGFGVLLIDPAVHDEQTIRTVGQFCDGRIDVRETDAGPELCPRGYPGASHEWTPFDPTPDS